MFKEKVSVGIMINDTIVQQWVYQSIVQLLESQFTNICLIVYGESSDGNLKGADKTFGSRAVRLYEALDRIIFRKPHDYYRKRDLITLRDRVDIYDFTDSTVTSGQSYNQTRELINQLRPDTIVLFGNSEPIEGTGDIPRFGYLRFSISQPVRPGGFDHGMHEVVLKEPLTETTVGILGRAKESPEILYRSRESTYRFSVNINRNKIYQRAVWVLPGIIEGLACYGKDYLERLLERNREVTARSEGLENGKSKVTFSKLLQHFARLVTLGLNKLLFTDAFSWNIIHKIDSSGFGNGEDLSSYNIIKRPKGKFWADPFVVADRDKYFLFVEEFVYRKNKAHISVLELDQTGKILGTKKVLERPYHLSYPFIFKKDDNYYMIPETSQNMTIELYKCTEFPSGWEFVQNLMEGITATDTTLFYHDNIWWLFTTVDRTNGISGGSTELFLFYSDDPFKGEWRAHPLNPVVSDESNARCAGSLFVRDGIIFRPSQDCSVRYGRALNVNHVIKLSTDEYKEVRTQVLLPDWDRKLRGIHTLNSEGYMTILDVYNFHSRFSIR